jgi:hypothetical protein
LGWSLLWISVSTLLMLGGAACVLLLTVNAVFLLARVSAGLLADGLAGLGRRGFAMHRAGMLLSFANRGGAHSPRNIEIKRQRDPDREGKQGCAKELVKVSSEEAHKFVLAKIPALRRLTSPILLSLDLLLA